MAVGVGSAVVLFGTSGPIVITLGVIAVGAGVYQLVAAAKGLTVGGAEVELTATQRAQVDAQVAQALPLLNTAQSIEFFNIPAGTTFKVDTSAFLNPQTVRDFAVAAPSDPARAASSTFLSTNDAHSLTLKPGAGLSDIVAVENSKGNPITLKDLLANNPNITNQDSVRAGLTVQIPERTSGNLTLNYGTGVTITTDLTGGEYHMVVPNADGGNTIYSRTADDSGYTIRQVATDRNGNTTYDFTGVQATKTSDVKPLSIIENTDAFSRTTMAQGDPNGIYSEVIRTFDLQGNLTSTATTTRAAVGGELTTTVDSQIGGNDVSVTYGYDANKTPVVQSLNSINGQAVDVATSDAFALQANLANTQQNPNATSQDLVTLTQVLAPAILPTLNVNVNNVDTAASTTTGSNGTVETVTLVDGSNVNLTGGNQYVSTTTAPPTDSAIAIELPVVLTPSSTTTTPGTTIINGVTITDNGDGTYAYSLPTATCGTQTISDNGDGAAVMNNYTDSGTLTGSETTGFDPDSRKRYKHRSCLRPYLLGCSTKTCLKTAGKCKKRASIKTSHSKPKLAQTTFNLGKKHNQKCLLIDIRRNLVRIKTSIQKETI